MISTLKLNNVYFFGGLLLLCLYTSQLIFAQESVSLSVTPTLFEMAASPSQGWKSSVKVVNSNSFPLTVYASVANFAPQGEVGQGKLLPVLSQATEGSTLAEWINIDSAPIVIPPEESYQIPFEVVVPEDASPGGHFAAILVSTKPPAIDGQRLQVQTSQIVSSLFFVRVAGDVIENGAIRSFSTAEQFAQSPHANFELRFENKGNVHLQPRGDITIYNMWGTKRGEIPINHSTHFGNVLPDSVRKFEFAWTGEQSITDIGRYKAIASLAYGLESKQFSNSTTYFWVVPLRPLLITIISIAAFILFVTWAIKLYVRRMLQLAGVPIHAEKMQVHDTEEVADNTDTLRVNSYRTIGAPMRHGYSDLRERLSQVTALLEILQVIGVFIRINWLFFVSVVVIVAGVVMAYFYIVDVTDTDRSYDVEITNPGAAVNLSSEEILYVEEAEKQQLPPLGRQDGQPFTIEIINTSGQTGVGAQAAQKLVVKEYSVTSIKTNPERLDKRTVVVFDAKVQDTAVKISQLFGGALLSARTSSSTEGVANITLFVGQDQI